MSQGSLFQRDIPRSSSYYRMAFKDHLSGKWTERWESDRAFARQAHIWFTKPSFRKSRAILGMGREDFSRAIRWLTGFAFLGGPNKVMGLCEDDTRRRCAQAPEKVDYLLLECPALNQLRWERFDAFQLNPPPLGRDWEVSSLLKFLGDHESFPIGGLATLPIITKF